LTQLFVAKTIRMCLLMIDGAGSFNQHAHGVPNQAGWQRKFCNGLQIALNSSLTAGPFDAAEK
jgi:hypothetical protein